MAEEKNKPRQAIALAYEPGDMAPKILATGKGALAEKIIEKAKEADVPLYRDDKLADTLSRLEIGDMIPPELYQVVAEILVFVEVKYRKNLNMGSPFEAVDIRKQQKIRRVCEWFLMEKKLYDIPVRFFAAF